MDDSAATPRASSGHGGEAESGRREAVAGEARRTMPDADAQMGARNGGGGGAKRWPGRFKALRRHVVWSIYIVHRVGVAGGAWTGCSGAPARVVGVGCVGRPASS
eukprot:scaffold28112_cov112-Isochrysis_galbana.AAC.7